MARNILRTEANQRIDAEDFQFMHDESFQNNLRQIQDQFLTDPAKSRSWIIDGFEPTDAGTQITVTKGRAILAQRSGAQVFYGVLTSEGDNTRVLDVSSGFPDGTYNIYVRFEFVDSNSQSRVFWNNAGNGSEFAQTIPTRKAANWSMRIELSSPGAEWLPIGTVTVVAAAITGTTDDRPLYFEGVPSATYATTWGGGSDRDDDRSVNGVKDLQSFVAATQFSLAELKPAGAKWWQARGLDVTGVLANETGVTGRGAATNGVGVAGIGAGSGDGVTGVSTTGVGGRFTGGTDNTGAVGQGTGTGIGVVGTGGVTNAFGGDFIGGGSNGSGVRGGGVGAGQGGSFNGGASGRGAQGTGGGAAEGLRGTGGATNGIGVVGQGTAAGHGFNGTGGATAGARGGTFSGGVGGGEGARGQGTGTEQGLVGIGGPTNGDGVEGLGILAGDGVVGTGGATSGARGGTFVGAAGEGVRGTGAALFSGGAFIGGAGAFTPAILGTAGTGGTGGDFTGEGGGHGVKATAGTSGVAGDFVGTGGGAVATVGESGGSGAGARGTGGGANGIGIIGLGGASNGTGGRFTASGNGVGAEFVTPSGGTGPAVWANNNAGANRSSFAMTPMAGDPSATAKGDAYTNTTGMLRGYDGANFQRYLASKFGTVGLADDADQITGAGGTFASTVVIPAGGLTANSVLRIQAWGQVDTPNAESGTFSLTIDDGVNGARIVASTGGDTAFVINEIFYLEATVVMVGTTDLSYHGRGIRHSTADASPNDEQWRGNGTDLNTVANAQTIEVNLFNVAGSGINIDLHALIVDVSA